MSFEDFGLLTLFTTFFYIAMIPFTALYATVNHKSAYLIAQRDLQSGFDFFTTIKRKTLLIAVTLSLLWIVSTPAISVFFHIHNVLVPLLFTPIIGLGLFTAANKGFLHGSFNFKAVGMIILFEVLAKLFFAWMLVTNGLHAWVYGSIPLSLLVAFLLSILLTPQKKNSQGSQTYVFPRKFFLASIATGLSTTAYLTFDLLLAKHFLHPAQAGEYALLSLIGKMIYFFGALPHLFLITLVSSDEGKKRDSRTTFHFLLTITFVLTSGAFITLGLFGARIIPFIFGMKAISIVPYVVQYSAAISFFVFSSTIVAFYLARQRYHVSLLSLLIAAGMGLGIVLYHDTIFHIIRVVLTTSIVSFTLTSALYVLESIKVIKLG